MHAAVALTHTVAATGSGNAAARRHGLTAVVAAARTCVGHAARTTGTAGAAAAHCRRAPVATCARRSAVGQRTAIVVRGHAAVGVASAVTITAVRAALRIAGIRVVVRRRAVDGLNGILVQADDGPARRGQPDYAKSSAEGSRSPMSHKRAISVDRFTRGLKPPTG
jgi:hypothetical protein